MLINNWIPKLIGLLLATIIGVCIPITEAALQSSLRSERLAWNTLVEYKDIVTRKGSITISDYNSFRNKLSATNKDWEVSLSVEDTYFYSTNDTKNTVSTFKATSFQFNSTRDNIFTNKNFKEGSLFKVTITPLTPSTSESFLNTIFNQAFYSMDYSIAGVFENTGAEEEVSK